MATSWARRCSMGETRPREAKVAVLACGALARETAQIMRESAWVADLHGLSSFHHLDPPRIARDVDRKLADLTRRYERVVVVYGDCGTGGALDRVLEKYPAVRPAGVHCYQWFLDESPRQIVENRTATYFFTDWLVRNWDRAVIKGLGLDRFPWLKDTYFGSLAEVLFLQQDPDPGLTDKAREIAEYMGLPLEVRLTGLDPLAAVIAPLMQDVDVRA
jgi:hypothetical protein